MVTSPVNRANSSGTISGTPSTAGSYTFTVTVADSGTSTARQSYTLTVNPWAPAVSLPPAPASQPKTVLLTVGSHSYNVDGRVSPMDVAPMVDQASGRTLVPVRYLAEALGVAPQDIKWDAATETVTLVQQGTPGTTVIFSIGSKVMKTARPGSYAPIQMDIAPRIVAGRTMAPARWVAQQLGYAVQWNPAKQQVILTQ